MKDVRQHRTRSTRRWAAVGALVGLSLIASAHTASADAPIAQGWWWSPNDLPATPPAAPVITVPVAPPGVPEDGLYVATNPSGMEALSAVLYALPEGGRASTLTLKVTGTTMGTPAIMLCPTQTNWAPAQGGAWGTRPSYNCGGSAPKGTLAADGTSMSWSLGALGQQGVVDLALVPVLADAPAQSSPFRVSFEKPGPESLPVTVAKSAEPFSTLPAFVPAPTTSFDSVDVVAAAETSFADASVSSFSAPSATLTTPVAGGAPRTNFFNPPARTGGLVANSTPATASRDMVQTIGMFGLIALAAVYARFSGQPEREPRSLVNFAKHRDAAGGGE